MTYILLLFVLFSSLSVFAEPVLDSWIVYSNPAVPVHGEEVTFPVEGNFVGSIKPPVLQLNEKTKLDDIDKYSFGWLDYYYLIQSINARNYKGNHLHISGYLKLDTSKVLQRISHYVSWRDDKKTKYFESLENGSESEDSSIDPNAKFYERLLNGKEIQFDQLLKNTDVKINVILSNKNGLVTHGSNSDFQLNSSQWQRLNVEIDVPVDCEAIAIVVWMQGFGNLYIDDFVISEQGLKIEEIERTGGIIRHYGKFEEKISQWLKNSKNRYAFENLGFEKSKNAH